MIVTAHAIKRFCERIRPSADEREARVVLSNACYRWAFLRRHTKTETLWRVENPVMILIVRHDPRWGQVIVTVWPEEYLSNGESDDR